MKYSSLHQDWLSNVRGDLLAGLVVALALIPEAIAFSIIAGLDPKVGLYAAFSIAVVIAFTGARPGMISAATGAMALLMVTLVKDHGLQYLLAATIMTGVLQILAGVLKLGLLMRFVSRSVITGFVNALAILIFMAQLPELTNVTWVVYAMTAAGLAIIYGFPYVTKAIPSPLVCIVVLTGVAMALGLDIRSVGDMGALPDSLPIFLLPDVPLNLETLQIVLPVSATLATVGLLESMMTASIIDDLTDSTSNKNRECVGQGLANITSGFLGGMAGCAMIGQSVINIKSGGRGRLSALAAGVFLLLMVPARGHIAASILLRFSVSRRRWHHRTKSLRRHLQGGIEFARQVLERNQGRQFNDGVVSEMLAQRRKMFGGGLLAGVSHHFGISQRRLLAWREQRAVGKACNSQQLFLADAAFQCRRRIDIDAEGTTVDLRDAHGDQGAQRRIDRRCAPVQRAIQQRQSHEHPG